MAPSTRLPTVHLRRPKGHSNWLDSQTRPIKVTHVAQGGSWGPHLSWWYDKISYAPVPSTVRPLCRQAKSDSCWPVRPLPCRWLGRWVFWSGMGSGVMSMYVEVLWRILGNFFLNLFFSFFLFIMEPFSFLLFLLLFASRFFFYFFLLKFFLFLQITFLPVLFSLSFP